MSNWAQNRYRVRGLEKSQEGDPMVRREQPSPDQRRESQGLILREGTTPEDEIVT